MTETYFDGENELTVVYEGNKTSFYLRDKIHRLDGPADIRYYNNGIIEREEYRVDGKRHRLDGPAEIWYDINGDILEEVYWVNGGIHRLDGPAIVNVIETEFWVNDNPHRLNGPAKIWYHENGNTEREEYWFDGNLHRLDGPAIVIYDIKSNASESEYYIINGEEIDTEQFPNINFENWPLSLEEQTLLQMSV